MWLRLKRQKSESIVNPRCYFGICMQLRTQYLLLKQQAFVHFTCRCIITIFRPSLKLVCATGLPKTWSEANIYTFNYFLQNITLFMNRNRRAEVSYRCSAFSRSVKNSYSTNRRLIRLPNVPATATRGWLVSPLQPRYGNAWGFASFCPCHCAVLLKHRISIVWYI